MILAYRVAARAESDNQVDTITGRRAKNLHAALTPPGIPCEMLYDLMHAFDTFKPRSVVSAISVQVSGS